MPNAIELMKTIKKAAVDAVRAEKPTEMYFGKVTSTSPLKILVEQKMTLGKAQLILSRNVTDFKVKISAGNIQNYYYTGAAAPAASTAPVSPSHVHAVGTIEVTVKNGLAKGDEVILIRQQGGQKYLVLDRVGI